MALISASATFDYLDIFQLAIAIYLFYMAWKGANKFINPEDYGEKKEQIFRNIRIFYIVGGCFALAEFGISTLRSRMFTQVTGDNNVVSIVQNFSVKSLPFLSYRFLTILSTILSILVVVALVGIIIYSRHNQKTK